MKEAMQHGLAFLIIVPYVLSAILFAGSRLAGRSQVKSIRMAADWTVPLLVMATAFVLDRMAAHAWLIVASGILIAGIGYAVAERVKSKEFSMLRMLRNYWRMLFIVFSLLYLVLLVIGAATESVGFLVQ
ncbi:MULTISPECIES: DUF3397 domain-containing protein [Sporosarcina]|uniref:DUF3397 domain-containing protein n=1 Tax=Sporosarcina TaxID=1569 RepID=UPI00058EB37E|nr:MULTISPECIES: DUF3397 domain-containing protein [Sporosarcina]WJY28824.1 DUF3397 domain-containing protein [Sporosarcina sp. 0.2-SM1T-5]